MFEINDTVLYGTEGVCKITEIARRNFGIGTTDYYVLKPIYREYATDYVPTNNELLTAKMRHVLSVEEIYDMISSMPDEPCIWIADDNERKLQYAEIITNSDRKQLVSLIKTLYLRQEEQRAKRKELHMSDKRYLKEAEKMLYDEFALVLDMKPDEVLSFILDRIPATEKVLGK